MGTGETIISSVTNGQTVGADTGSSKLVWSVDMNTHRCEGINGYTGISHIGFGDDIDATGDFAIVTCPPKTSPFLMRVIS